MHPIVALFIVALVVGGVVFLLRPSPMFVVDFRNGKAIARSSKVPKSFLYDCEGVLSMHKLRDGWIKAYASRSRVSLRYSPSIPRQYHQNFRNIWQVNRW